MDEILRLSGVLRRSDEAMAFYAPMFLMTGIIILLMLGLLLLPELIASSRRKREARRHEEKFPEEGEGDDAL